MQVLTILITGFIEGFTTPSWVKAELQKVLDRHAPFIGSHLRVKLVERISIDPEGGVYRTQTEEVKP